MKTIPDRKDMETLAKNIEKPLLIPKIKTSQDFKNPYKIYSAIRKKYNHSFLLESLEGPKNKSRYSITGYQPLLHLKIKNQKPKITGLSNATEIAQKRIHKIGKDSDELEILRKSMFLDEMKILSFNLPRYVLGVTGYLGYDYVRTQLELDNTKDDDLKHPTLEFMLPKSVIVFDHLEKNILYTSQTLLTENTNLENSFTERKNEPKKDFDYSGKKFENETKNISLDSNIKKEEFENSVEKIKEYIQAGDVIQTVLSQRIDLKPAPNLEKFYSRLRKINPSPYMFFLDFSSRTIIGSSPEALVRVQGNEVLTRPIAGTRKRGESEEEDFAMEQDLLEDEKERSEHVMLVDLGRNDIGKISKFGEVDTSEFMEIEKYGDVQHIVSTVVGELADEKDAIDAFKAVFPAGTVSGAPKVRSMEIIEELEPTKRGIYSGAIGTFSYTGEADFAIAIRTLTEQEDEAHIQVGAGIVADSVPEKEYRETRNKAKSLLRAAGVIE